MAATTVVEEEAAPVVSVVVGSVEDSAASEAFVGAEVEAKTDLDLAVAVAHPVAFGEDAAVAVVGKDLPWRPTVTATLEYQSLHQPDLSPTKNL